MKKIITIICAVLLISPTQIFAVQESGVSTIIEQLQEQIEALQLLIADMPVTPSGTIPATPAIPNIGSGEGGGATPATPATPAHFIYTITVTQGANGTISPETTSVVKGDEQTFIITPDVGYKISNVIVDGIDQGIIPSYTFTNVTTNHSITANYEQILYTITVTQGENGTITPDTVFIPYGGSQTFTIAPSAGYKISSLIVDGANVAPEETYTFSDVTAAHTLSAAFAPVPSTPTIAALSPSAFHQFNPSVYGNIVTWADARNGKWEVFYRDITEGEDVLVSGSDFVVNASLSPKVYGRSIVYADNTPYAYLYDIDTKQTTKVSDSSSHQYCPDIFGDYVVWMDDRHSNEPGMVNKADIYLKDLSSGEEKSLSGTVLTAGCPRIQGNNVVWSDNSSSGNLNDSDVFSYNLSTNHKTQVTNAIKNQRTPAVYGGIIIWEDYRNATDAQYYNADLYMYNIATQQETQLTNDDALIGTGENSRLFQGSPAIYGNTVAFQDNVEDPTYGDVMSMDIASKSTANFIGTDGLNSTQSRPAIYENTIAWMDYRSGIPNIYISQ